MSNNKKLLLIVTTACLLIPLFLSAQVDTAWTRRYNGPANTVDQAFALAIDGQGNVYVTGESQGSGTDYDYATIKYNSAGVAQWTQRYNGPANIADHASAITSDGSGNNYVTGRSHGTYLSVTSFDYATIKYNSAGVQQWVQRYNGSGNGNDEARAIAVDNSGNVYVTGYSRAATGAEDYATVKYTTAGVQQWVATYNGLGGANDEAYALAIDDQGNVYVTGRSYMASGSWDFLTIKYNSSGDTVWVRSYNGPGNNYDFANAIAVDNYGNVYVTGESQGSGTGYDYATIKYNSAGAQQWVQRYNGPASSEDSPKSIAVDPSGNVYITGHSYGSGTSTDCATIKYNSAGVQQWLQRYNGTGNGADYARALKLDAQSNVYITGTTWRTTFDYLTIKYNSAGIQQWLATHNDLGNFTDDAYSLAVDNQGNVYVTGTCSGSGTSADYVTIKYVSTGAIEEGRLTHDAKRNTLEIFPNPAKSYFAVRLPLTADRIEIKIFDVSGKLVKSEEVKAKNCRVSLNGIRNGIYFIQVGNVMVKEKLVVTK